MKAQTSLPIVAGFVGGWLCWWTSSWRLPPLPCICWHRLFVQLETIEPDTFSRAG